MGLFTSKEFNSLEDLFIDQIEDLYDAEKRLCQALPKMADAAQSPQLKQAFHDHLRETEHQCQRLEQVFQEMGRTPSRETCKAMQGLIQEGEAMIDATGDHDVKDAALIAAAQRIEHYEISGYGTARTFAQRLGMTHAAELLQETLNEERETDQHLTEIAEQSVNIQASH